MFRLAAWLLIVSFIPALVIAQTKDTGVTLIERKGQNRVDVLIGGSPFTSYIFEERNRKPVLYPLRTAKGALVTRGYPLEPRAGERTDHPHHIGSWFNYGDVNGLDFWNNSEKSTRDSAHLGSILHKRVEKIESGANRGELAVSCDWVDSKGNLLLREKTRFIFTAEKDRRLVDRITTLTADQKPVTLGDNKEGLFAIRVARELEQSSMETNGGHYRSSEGKVGDQVWGSRGRWVTLSGKIGDEDITVAIFDHAKNPNHPTHWHARGYGLFAANPLGQKVFGGKEELKLTLNRGESVTFRFRLAIINGVQQSVEVENLYRRFNSEFGDK
jgi:hypothetical protein